MLFCMHNVVVLSEMRRFECDEEKDRANLAKNKIGFETAKPVFDDRLR